MPMTKEESSLQRDLLTTVGDILRSIEQHGKYLKSHEIRLAKIEEQNKTANAAADATQTLTDNTSAEVSATKNRALLEAAVKVASKGGARETSATDL